MIRDYGRMLLGDGERAVMKTYERRRKAVVEEKERAAEGHIRGSWMPETPLKKQRSRRRSSTAKTFVASPETLSEKGKRRRTNEVKITWIRKRQRSIRDFSGNSYEIDNSNINYLSYIRRRGRIDGLRVQVRKLSLNFPKNCKKSRSNRRGRRHTKDIDNCTAELELAVTDVTELCEKLQILNIKEEVEQIDTASKKNLTVQGVKTSSQSIKLMAKPKNASKPKGQERQRMKLPKIDQRGQKENQEDEKWLEAERTRLHARIHSFTTKNKILGDRTFKLWNGSVVDSIVGVFLTQNVFDFLSSQTVISIFEKYGNNFRGLQCADEKEFSVMEDCQRVDTVEPNFPTKYEQKEEEEEDVQDALNEQKGDGDKIKTEKTKDLRIQYSRQRNASQMDVVNWKAVLQASQSEIAETIKARGQHYEIATKIQIFLSKEVKFHGSIDMEWLRYAPPDIAKKVLLGINGIGLKSAECIRLLELQHVAFPVDVNVGTIVIRLGWVPLVPSSGALFHEIQKYPEMDRIQKYLWRRLCVLDHQTLYELHYQMITFGKVFCLKKNPNCNACPMKAECRYFASKIASERLSLPSVEERAHTSFFHGITPTAQNEDIEDIKDIEDIYDDGKLNDDEFAANIQYFLDKYNREFHDGKPYKVTIPSVEEASIPTQNKDLGRLRSEHKVYEIPDDHKILFGIEKRECDDRMPYMLDIWLPGDTPETCVSPKRKCILQRNNTLCDDPTCYSCESIREERDGIVRGTILIPCRTAMRGSFPLNGTYFQINEVFADHETSYHPLTVQKTLISHLPTRTIYIGTSTSSIVKGLDQKQIEDIFAKGAVCFRGFERSTGGSRPLSRRFYCPPSKMDKMPRKTKLDKLAVAAASMHTEKIPDIFMKYQSTK